MSVEAREFDARNRGVQMVISMGTILRKMEQRTGERSGQNQGLGEGEEAWKEVSRKFKVAIVKVGETKKATMKTKGREIREKMVRAKTTGAFSKGGRPKQRRQRHWKKQWPRRERP